MYYLPFLKHAEATVNNPPADSDEEAQPPAKRTKQGHVSVAQAAAATKAKVSAKGKSSMKSTVRKGKASAAGRARGSKQYTPREDKRLVDIWWTSTPTGKDGVAECAAVYNKWAFAHHFPSRTPHALTKRLKMVCCNYSNIESVFICGSSMVDCSNEKGDWRCGDARIYSEGQRA